MAQRRRGAAVADTLAEVWVSGAVVLVMAVVLLKVVCSYGCCLHVALGWWCQQWQCWRWLLIAVEAVMLVAKEWCR